MGINLNSLLNRFIWNGLGIMIICSPLLVGGFPWPVQMAVGAISALVFCAYLLLLFRKGQRLHIDGFVVLGLAALTVMLFQSMPLSVGMLKSLSPEAFCSAEAARTLGADAVNRISLAPVKTTGAILALLSALLVYLVAFNLAFRNDDGERVLKQVGTAAIVVAVIALAHWISGTGKVLWLYEPVRGPLEDNLAFSTFVNNNHGAAFLNLGFLVLIGVARKAHVGMPKAMFSFTVVLTLVASVAMLSRGGMLAMMVGLGLFFLVVNWTHSARPPEVQRRGVVLTGFVISAVCAAIFLVVFSLALKHVGSSPLIPVVEEELKIKVWEKSAPAVAQFKKAGAGAGAFEEAFTPLNDFAPTRTFTHAENEIIELSVEYGVVLVVVGLLFALLLFWRRLSFARSKPLYAAALAGVFAVAVQNLADFNIRMPGVAIPLAAVLGACGGAFARHLSKEDTWQPRVRAIFVLPIAVVLIFALPIGHTWTRANEDSQAYVTLEEMRKDAGGTLTSEMTESAVSQLGRLHSADAHFWTLVGLVNLDAKEMELALSRLQHASTLCPACIPPRAALARAQAVGGDWDGALAGLLTIVKSLPTNWDNLYETLIASNAPVASIVRVWGEDPKVFNGLVRHLTQTGRDEQAYALSDQQIAGRGPDPDLLFIIGQSHYDSGHLDEADLMATYLIGLFPERYEGFYLQARIFVARKELDMALLMYEEARTRTTEFKTPLSLELLSLLGTTRQWNRFETIASDLRDVVRHNARYRSKYHIIMAVRRERMGDLFAAIRELDQAEAATPLEIEIALRKASLLLRLDQANRAAAQYRKALKIDPSNQTALDGIRSLEIDDGLTTR